MTPVSTAAFRPPAKSLALALGLTGAGFVAIAVAIAGTGWGLSQPTLAIYSSGLLYLALLWWWHSTRPQAGILPSWVEPPAVITAWTLLWIYLPAVVAFFDYSLFDEAATAHGSEALLVMGVLLACVSLTVLSGAYHTTAALLRRRTQPSLDARIPSVRLVVGLYIVSAAARLFRLVVLGIAFGADTAGWGSLQSLDQWIGYVEDLRFLALALLVAHVVRFGKARVWLVIALVAELAFGATSGFLMHLIRPVVICVIAAAALDRWRGRYVAMLAAAALLISTFLPVVVAIREDRTGALGTAYRSGLGPAFADVGSYWMEGLTRLDAAYSKFFGRQTEVASSTGLIVELTPRVVPYEGLERFLILPANLVPRLLWPSKPTLSRGVWFSVTFRGLDEDTTSWSAMTLFSEGYLFFGWTGVVLAMVIVGIILAVFKNGLDSPRFLVVYLALLPTLLEIEPELSSYLTSLIQRSFVFVVVFLVLTHRSTKRIAVLRIA